MKRVAVFFGGASNEHEISVLTGMMAVNLLKSAGYEVLPVFLPLSGGMTLAKNASRAEDVAGESRFPAVQLNGPALERKRGIFRKRQPFDVALNCCHGGMGEDGTLAALLAWNKVPSASPSAELSAAFMDKSLCKLAAKGLGLPVLPSVCVREGETERAGREADRLGYPLVVKPCRLGSSIGITVVKEERELLVALALAFRLDRSALLEPYLPGRRDLNCAAVKRGGEIVLSPIEEVLSFSPILTFGEKYEGTERRSLLPADIPEGAAHTVRESMRAIAEAFGLCGVIRGDFFLTKDGSVYFNELNAVPGSLAFYLFGDTLLDARDFLSALVEEAALPPEKRPVCTGLLSRTRFAGAKGCKNRASVL